MPKKKSKASKTKVKEPKSIPFAEKSDKIMTKHPDWNRRSVMGVSLTDYSEVKFLGGDGVHDPWIQRNQGEDIPKNYIPRMNQVPINVQRSTEGVLTIKKFTAAETEKFGTLGTEYPDVFTGAVSDKNKIIFPKYYQNPYQYQDFVYLQDIYANTICGRIFDTIGFFALAEGVQPKLKVKNESDFPNDEAKRKALEEHQWMIDEIMEIEKNVSISSNAKAFDDISSKSEYPVGPISTAQDAKTPTYDTSLQKKWFAAFINQMMFGRAMIVPRIDEKDNQVEVNVNGREVVYKNIPKIMLVIHPRDMGFNYVDYMTHRLLGIQLNTSNWILRPDEMIFFEWSPDNPVYGSKFYGMSAAQSMMGSARTLRRIIEVDFPLIAKTRWSGMYWLVFKQKGEMLGTRDAELAAILSNIELNGINATMEENPKEDFMLHKIDLDPKIEGLLQTVRELIQYMMSQVGMPQGLLYGEQDLNRDTFKSKIASWTKGTLKRYRQPFLEVVKTQWYGRLTKTLEKQDEEWKTALKLFDVIATINEFKLDSTEELINSATQLQNLTGPWKDEAIAEYLEMPDLQQKVDPTKGPEDIPEMPGQKGMTVKDNKGQEFGVSNNG